MPSFKALWVSAFFCLFVCFLINYSSYIWNCHDFKLWLFDINHNVPLCLWLVIGREGVCHPVHHDTARLWRQASTRSTLFKFPLTEFCSSVFIASVSLDRGWVQAAVSRIYCKETRKDLISTVGIMALFPPRSHAFPFFFFFFLFFLKRYSWVLSSWPLLKMHLCELKCCKAFRSFLLVISLFLPCAVVCVVR